MDPNNRRAAHDRPARESKLVWIIATILLIILLVIGVFAFNYGITGNAPGAEATGPSS